MMMKIVRYYIPIPILFFLLFIVQDIDGFGVATTTTRARTSRRTYIPFNHGLMALNGDDVNNDNNNIDPILTSTATTTGTSSDADSEEDQKKAATGTVNERLLAELKEAENNEKYGARSKLGAKMGLGVFRSAKTEQERQASIEEARDLNGVNPVTTIVAGIVALGMAAIVWAATDAIAEYYALHPIDETVYFVARIQAVVRNVVIGGFALASGFCGVTGIGILLLGIRVAHGVAKGELDPTPLPSKQSTTVSAVMDQQQQQPALELSKVWDLMLNKSQKRGRR